MCTPYVAPSFLEVHGLGEFFSKILKFFWAMLKPLKICTSFQLNTQGMHL